jgi:hypothetical protein
MNRNEQTGWLVLISIVAINLLVARFNYWWLLLTAPLSIAIGIVLWMFTFWNE